MVQSNKTGKSKQMKGHVPDELKTQEARITKSSVIYNLIQFVSV